MDARTRAIVAHLTLIGWIIAFIVNSNEKHEFATFHLRQTLGIYLIGIVLGWVPVFGWICNIILFAFWLLSFIYALQGQQKTIPFGEYFQDWFKAL